MGKGHIVDSNVKASLTFCAPIMRQMATTSTIAPITANTTTTATSPETDTRLNVRLAFGEMHEIPDLKLSNNF